MIYRNSDKSVQSAMDRYAASDFDTGVVGAICGICDESIYKDEDYYSNGDMDMCCSCYRDFVKVWD